LPPTQMMGDTHNTRMASGKVELLLFVGPTIPLSVDM
jgi:hypothetical protein